MSLIVFGNRRAGKQDRIAVSDAVAAVDPVNPVGIFPRRVFYVMNLINHKIIRTDFPGQVYVAFGLRS